MTKKEKIKELIGAIPLEFELKDFMQIIIGASILAVPVGFTQEIWTLAETLPWINVIGISVLSMSFISFFVYYHYHKIHHMRGASGHWKHFFRRAIGTYLLSLLVVGIILSLVQINHFILDFTTAVRKTIMVALPASMSAMIADTIK